VSAFISSGKQMWICTAVREVRSDVLILRLPTFKKLTFEYRILNSASRTFPEIAS